MKIPIFIHPDGQARIFRACPYPLSTLSSQLIFRAIPPMRFVFREKNGVDLIVIGNKGAGAVERFLIGSVSSKVVSHAPCSVLVVKK